MQRTEKAPQDRNLAENDPQQFASILAKRLQKIVDDEDNLRRVHESIESIEEVIIKLL